MIFRTIKLLLLLTACTVAMAQSVDEDQWHDVQPGETMSTIARQYYGPDASWRIVAAQNPEIPDPQSLVPGMRLRIDPAFVLPAVTPRAAPAAAPVAAEPITTTPAVEEPRGKPEPAAVKPTTPARDKEQPAVTQPVAGPEPEDAATQDPVEAVIEEITNEVDRNSSQQGWEDAIVRERLVIGDGLRTLSASSARLRVDDSRISLTEFTQLYLREREPAAGVLRDRRVDLERGELVVDAPDPKVSAVRFGIGDNRVVPVAGAGPTLFRLRKTKLGGMKVMVYSGSVRATGNHDPVVIESGFGTTVEAGGPPDTPTRLLEPPELIAPATGVTLPPSNIAFEWRFRDGALNYRVEICGDKACNQLVRRKLGLADTRWLTGSLGVGDYFWRVVTVNPDELDGYAGDAVPFSVRDASGKTAPGGGPMPGVVLVVIGGLVLIALLLIAFLWPRPKRRRR